MENNNDPLGMQENSASSFFFTEPVSRGVNVTIDLKRVISSTHSKFQKVEIIETTFGKTLVTDGSTQSTQADEFVYHESLVHPAFLQSGLLNESSKPQSVFIGGGGELATAREALRHKSVQRVVMVDLDEKVVELCKEFLPEWGGTRVTSDPRFELIIGDAYAYITNCTEKFDVIIMDISDPVEAGPGIMLYTKEFYDHARTLLNRPNGVFVTQAGIANIVPAFGVEPGSYRDRSCLAPIINTLKTSFDHVMPYTVNIPSFGSEWGFVIAFSSTETMSSTINITQIERDAIDKNISETITEIEDVHKNGTAKDGSEVLKFYDGETHQRMFALSKPLRNGIKKDVRVITKDKPVFMF